MTSIERFWSKVDKRGPDDCWNWKGGPKLRYGLFWNQGRNVGAHRFIWEHENESIPLGINVCHKCDNPRCCNPRHLFLGTTQDNVKDRHSKGRTATRLTGKNCASILTSTQVRDIRILKTLGVGGSVIVKRYNITKQTLCDISKGRSWKSVPLIPIKTLILSKSD
jgi:hypothetical protein